MAERRGSDGRAASIPSGIPGNINPSETNARASVEAAAIRFFRTIDAASAANAEANSRRLVILVAEIVLVDFARYLGLEEADTVAK